MVADAVAGYDRAGGCLCWNVPGTIASPVGRVSWPRLISFFVPSCALTPTESMVASTKAHPTHNDAILISLQVNSVSGTLWARVPVGGQGSRLGDTPISAVGAPYYVEFAGTSD
jgi:hypothetical protein